MTSVSHKASTSRRALQAGGALGVAAIWLAAWFSVEGAIYVWLMLLGIYVLFLSAAPFVVRSTGDDSRPLGAWLARFARVGGWFVLSGFLAMGIFVIYAIVMELTGNSLYPQ